MARWQKDIGIPMTAVLYFFFSRYLLCTAKILKTWGNGSLS